MRLGITVAVTVGVMIAGAASCGDSDADPPVGSTTSNPFLGGDDSIPAGSAPTINNAPANPQAPLDPVGSDASVPST